MVLLHVLRALAGAMSIVCGLGVLLGIAYTITASVLVGRFFSRAAEPRDYPGVTVAKPLHGDEWQLVQHLESFFVQNYPVVQHLFGVHDANDKALVAVEALRARYPEANIKVVADARLYGPNRKIANLVNMLEHAGIRCSVSPTATFGSSAIIARRRRRAAAAGGRHRDERVSRHRIAGLLARCRRRDDELPFPAGRDHRKCFLGRARPCFGQTIAITRATLERIGGLTRSRIT